MKQLYSGIFFIVIILTINCSIYAQPVLIKPVWQQNASVNDLKFTNDGSELITVGNDINIWETQHGSLIKKIKPVVANPFWSVAISKDGKSFVTGNGTYTCDDYCYAVNAFLSKYFIDGTLNMHISTGETLADALNYSPDGNTVAAAFHYGSSDVDGIVSIYDTSLNGINSFYGHVPYGAASVQFTPNDKYLVSGGWQDGNAQIWDYHADTLVHSLPHGGYTGDGGNDLHISISPDSKYVVTAGLGQYSGKVKVWRIADGALLYSFNTTYTGSGSGVMIIPSFSPDGKYIIASISGGTTPSDYKFMIWNFNGTLLKETDMAPGYISALTFSPIINNKYFFAYGLSTGTTSSVNVVSVDLSKSELLQNVLPGKPAVETTGTPITILTNPFADALAFTVNGNPGGKLVATLSDLSGKPIIRTEFNNSNNQTIKIPLNKHINSGIYMLTIQLNDKTYSFKLIKD